jgi:putative sigma-54 modulation protein
VQVSVTFRHVDASAALRDHATDKVTRIAEKYLRAPETAHIILSVNKHRHEADITIHALHSDISAHECTEDLYSAIDLAAAKLETQLRKQKDRLSRRKGQAPAAKQEIEEPEQS